MNLLKQNLLGNALVREKCIEAKRKNTFLFFKYIQYLRGSWIWNLIKKYRNTNSKDDNKINRSNDNIFAKEVCADTKISIVVPVFNTPKRYLQQMIESVVGQTYKNWELCVADASEEAFSYVKEIIEKYVVTDKRVKYKKLKTNNGISANTNCAIEMASGDYIALLDHDDMLNKNALMEVVSRILDTKAELIYTDELVFKEDDVSNVLSYNYKPDYSIYNLRAVNYICHFTVFKKNLLNVVGGFDSKYDGSQDHDFILRLTEKTNKVEHISKVLYYWRAHDNSVAKSLYAKNYAIDAGQKAVLESIRRNGIEATIESSIIHPTVYKVNYTINMVARVLIVVEYISSVNELICCIKKIKKSTKYTNFECVILNRDERNDIPNFISDEIICSLDELNISEYDFLVFLDSNIQVLGCNWLNELLMIGQRDDVGVVGGKISNSKLQCLENGLILTFGSKHAYMRSHSGWGRFSGGYMNRLFFTQNVSAVSSRMMLVSTKRFVEVGGFSAEFVGDYRDIDLSLKLLKKGYVNVINPYAEGYYYKKYDNRNFLSEQDNLIKDKWIENMGIVDPYYNCNLSDEKSWVI